MISFREFLNEQEMSENYSKYNIITPEFTRKGKPVNFKEIRDMFSEDYSDEFKTLNDFEIAIRRHFLKYFKNKNSFSTVIENLFYDEFSVSLDKNGDYIVNFKDEYKTKLIFRSKIDPSLTNGL